MRKLTGSKKFRGLRFLALPALVPAMAWAGPLALQAPEADAPPAAVAPATPVVAAPAPQNPLADPRLLNNKILVLPFYAVNPADTNGWVGKSVQESLVADLISLAPDRVVSTTQSAPTVEAAIALGHQNRARYVVAGGFVTSERELRITGQVLDVETGKAIAALKVTGEPSQIFRMEDGLAAQVKAPLFNNGQIVQPPEQQQPQAQYPQPQRQPQIQQPAPQQPQYEQPAQQPPQQQEDPNWGSVRADAGVYTPSYSTYATPPSVTYVPSYTNYVYTYPSTYDYGYSYPSYSYGYGYPYYSSSCFSFGVGLGFFVGSSFHHHHSDYRHGNNYNHYNNGNHYYSGRSGYSGISAPHVRASVSGPGFRSAVNIGGSSRQSNFSGNRSFAPVRSAPNISHAPSIGSRGPSSVGRSSGVSRSFSGAGARVGGGASHAGGGASHGGGGGGGHSSGGHGGGGHR